MGRPAPGKAATEDAHQPIAQRIHGTASYTDMDVDLDISRSLVFKENELLDVEEGGWADASDQGRNKRGGNRLHLTSPHLT
jgi:hypothetical protein